MPADILDDLVQFNVTTVRKSLVYEALTSVLAQIRLSRAQMLELMEYLIEDGDSGVLLGLPLLPCQDGESLKITSIWKVV